MRVGILGSGLMGDKLGTIFARADAVLLAVHWSRIDDVLKQAPDLSDKVIVSCSLPMNAANTELVIAHTSSVSEALARDVGFDPVDAGPLRIARYTEPFALLIGQLAYEWTGGPELAHRFERFGR